MIERLEELNRVLDAALTIAGAGPGSKITVDSLLRLCRSTVRRGLFPDHEQTLDFAERLGFLRLSDGHAEVTRDGATFMSLNLDRYYELTDQQTQFLARTRYLGGHLSVECRGLMAQFRRSTSAPHFRWSDVDDAALDAPSWLVSHCCQLKLLQRTDSGLLSEPTADQLLASLLDKPKGITEAQLRKLLDEQDLLGNLGEELALEYESRRLQSSGCVVEAHCIRRISKIRVNAGYDIESFDAHAPMGAYDRFIEVKATRADHVRFYWSENEMKVAEELGDRYWIYVFPNVNLDDSSSNPPILIQDPIRSVLQSEKFSKRSQGMFIEENDGGIA